MKNTDKSIKQVCILLSFYHASTYHTQSHHGFVLSYSVTPLFFFYSSQSEQEVSRSLSAFLLWRFNLVNFLSDKVIVS